MDPSADCFGSRCDGASAAQAGLNIHQRVGYHWRTVAENVAAGQKSYGDVMLSWEQSSGHRENLLLTDVSAAGVAMAKSKSGRPYWTLVVGTEARQ